MAARKASAVGARTAFELLGKGGTLEKGRSDPRGQSRHNPPLPGYRGIGFGVFTRACATDTLMYTNIVPPAKTSFDFATNHGLMSLSPDGRSMVFAATGEGGESQLYLRRLDAAAAYPLGGAQNGAFPFWSPDSRWVAFFADGMLKKINTQGGTPIQLAEAEGSGSMGGSWSPKGVVVFATTTFAPLLKISSDGGSPTPAVASDASMGVGHGFPWFLPDGEHFLFASWVGAGHMTIRVGSLSSAATSLVTEADSNAEYVDGHLLYLRGNSLGARSFDLKTLHNPWDLRISRPRRPSRQLRTRSRSAYHHRYPRTAFRSTHAVWGGAWVDDADAKAKFSP